MAARLPDCYLITDEPGADRAVYFARLETALTRGVRLVQLRAKLLDGAALKALAVEVLARCRRQGARLLINSDIALVSELGADGVHLTSAQLMALEHRPLGVGQWVAASCHDEAQVLKANRMGVDFIVIGPVLPTTSHPGQPSLGWERFAALVDLACVPAFALGGMGPQHLGRAWRHGAQGIAAIRGLLDQ